VRGRGTEVVTIAALAAIVILAIAAPVVRAPSERLFGMEIVGRHHDPFTVMAQFERPIAIGVYSQPVTDVTGTLLARAAGAVAAYNWLVLLSFPLAAVTAYLLARYLQLSPVGSGVAALAYAFSPFHLAHAAYHPHVAQIQWIPLYLLALWRCLDRATPAAVAFLGAATIAVTLSNFYGGLIAAVITLPAIAGHWLFVVRRGDGGTTRSLAITAGSLAVIALSGVAYALLAAQAVIQNRTAFAFPRIDLFHYSARGWSYLMPPAAHPLFGATAQRIWHAAGVRDGLLEQQVSLGAGLIALALIACLAWLRLPRDRQRGSIARIPVLAIVAAAAFACSLSPEWTIGGFNLMRPSAVLYGIVPMFRAYARFGIVVQLSAALLAGIGVDYLRRTGNRRAQIACLALVALAVCEYAVRPSSQWRDVLPTAAHRWVMQQPGGARALDCAPLDQTNQPVPWLTAYRVTMRDRSTDDCTEPHFSRKIAAMGYTHLIVRTDTAEGRWFSAQRAVDGLRVAASFEDGQVFAVTATAPAVYTAAMTGFFRREQNAKWSWRWMGGDSAWTIVNTGAQPVTVVLAIELSAYRRARSLELWIDGCRIQTLEVEPSRHRYEIGPLTVPPGDHDMTFHPTDRPDAGGNAGGSRRVSIAVGWWDWLVQGQEP